LRIQNLSVFCGPKARHIADISKIPVSSFCAFQKNENLKWGK